MNIACLSGKGGAGKTMVAVNLAVCGEKSTYIDCDVEEPNGRLFFKPEKVSQTTVTELLPEFDSERCIGCRKCVDFCRFHALMYIKEKPRVFSEVCHSCGGCEMVCPEHAIREIEKPIGILEEEYHHDVKVVTGVLNPGEASGIPVIREALKRAEEFTIIDCPPGSACSVMESVMHADYCVLVAEPTAFGFHNFKMVCELVRILGKKCGVVINKQETEYPPLMEFCQKNQLPILATIPYMEEAAQAIARGQILSEVMEEGKEIFQEIIKKIGGAL